MIFVALTVAQVQSILDVRNTAFEESPQPVLNLLRRIYLPIQGLTPDELHECAVLAEDILNGAERPVARRFLSMSGPERLLTAILACEQYFTWMATQEPGPQAAEVSERFWSWFASLDRGFNFLALPVRTANVPGLGVGVTMGVIIKHRLTKLASCMEVFHGIRRHRWEEEDGSVPRPGHPDLINPHAPVAKA